MQFNKPKHIEEGLLGRQTRSPETSIAKLRNMIRDIQSLQYSVSDTRTKDMLYGSNDFLPQEFEFDPKNYMAGVQKFSKKVINSSPKQRRTIFHDPRDTDYTSARTVRNVHPALQTNPEYPTKGHIKYSPSEIPNVFATNNPAAEPFTGIVHQISETGRKKDYVLDRNRQILHENAAEVGQHVIINVSLFSG